MNSTISDLDQAEDETLIHEISDEALEASAARHSRAEKATYSIISPFCV